MESCHNKYDKKIYKEFTSGPKLDSFSWVGLHFLSGPSPLPLKLKTKILKK